MGLDKLKRRLEEMQSPRYAADVFEKKYSHIRCPQHHATLRVVAVPGKPQTYNPRVCCGELLALVNAERAKDGQQPWTMPVDEAAAADTSSVDKPVDGDAT